MKGLSVSRISMGGFVLLLLVLGVSMAATGTATAQSADIVVATDRSGDYTSIQNAVGNAASGDRIKIKSGTYNQQTEIYNKKLEIYAPNGATIANSSSISSESAFRLYSDVTVSGLTLKNWKWGINSGGSSSDWTARNLTITDSYQAITGYDSSGNWTVTNTTIRNARQDGIEMQLSSGDLAVRDTKLINVGDGINGDGITGNVILESLVVQDGSDEALDVDNINAQLTISSSTIENVDSDGIYFDSDSSGTVSIKDTNIRSVRNGVHAEKAPVAVTVSNLSVTGTTGDGIDASNSTGDWTVKSSTFTNMGDKSIDVIDSGGKWQIHESVLTGGREGAVDAWGADQTVNATYNYWGADDGPSDQFDGSGGGAGGDIVVTPYYTDASLTALSGNTKPVELRVNDAPQTVQPNSSFSVNYDIENNGQAATAYTLTSTVNRSNVTVTDFTGDIRSRTPSADPPTASTSSIDSGQAGAVTITYQVDANTSGGVSIDTTAEAPLSGNSDAETTVVPIQTQTVPTDPTQRVLQVTGKQTASELTQGDVTTLITLKSRNSNRNGVAVSQSDVTTVITLFARNN